MYKSPTKQLPVRMSWPKHLAKRHAPVVLERIAEMHGAMDTVAEFVKQRGVRGVSGFAYETMCVVEDNDEGRMFTNFLLCDQKARPAFAFEFSTHKESILEFIKTEFCFDSGRFYSKGFENVEHAVEVEADRSLSVYFNSSGMSVVIELLKAMIDEYNANGRI